MTGRTAFWVTACSLGLMLLVVEMIRRRKLAESSSLLWFVLGTVLTLLALSDTLLGLLAGLLGISPGHALLSAAALFLLVILLHDGVRLAALERRTKTLTQELALLRDRVETESGSGGEPPIEAHEKVPPARRDDG